MKKLLFLSLAGILLASAAVFADETDITDEWAELGKMQNAWDDQKIITDDQFDKIIEQRTKKSKEKAEKKFKKKMGEALTPNITTDTNIQSIKQIAQDFPTLLVPKTLIFDDMSVTPGFYRILSAETKDGRYFINFYQGNNLVAKIPARETNNDYDAETINYAKIIYTENDNRAKVVYGCLDYNLVAEVGTK